MGNTTMVFHKFSMVLNKQPLTLASSDSDSEEVAVRT